jgi:hypothetical protein
MPIKLWKYEEVEVRDDVKLALPSSVVNVQLFKTVSGDTGKTYYIYKLTPKVGKAIYLCNCPEGIFRAPIEVFGAGRGCKHIEHLAEYLEGRK